MTMTTDDFSRVLYRPTATAPFNRAASRRRVPVVLAVMLAMGATVNTSINAQSKTTAVVSTTAPVFLLPDATRKPLVTLTAGTPVSVSEVRADWVQVTFQDPSLGPRIGWMRRDAVRLSSAQGPAVPKPSAPIVTGPRRSPLPARRPAEPLGVRGFGRFVLTKMAASDTFKAVADSDTFPAYGGGIQVTNVWNGLFVEVAADRSTIDGERVFVFADEVFPLGIPLRVTTTAIDVIAGWRGRSIDRVVPFVGGGATFMRYDETSDFADADEDVADQGPGFVAVGGVEVMLGKWLSVGGEVRYRFVPGVLGEGGVSSQFSESNLGGFGGGVRVIVGR